MNLNEETHRLVRLEVNGSLLGLIDVIGTFL